jgi:hypothetical protein
MISRQRSLPRWLLAGLVVVVGAALALRLPAELAVRLETVVAPKPDFGPQAMVVAPDERIFTLFAALNAAGYARQYEGVPMLPVRQDVSAALAEKDLPSLERLGKVFERMEAYHLVNWALQRGAGPGSGRAEPGWWITTRAADFYGLDVALGAFYVEADIPALWQSAAPAYDAQIAGWQPLAEAASHRLLTYLRMSEYPFRQLVIIPNLLDSHYSGYGPQIGEIAYVVAGPTETELSLSGLIEHEALHSTIGPMLDRQIDLIPRARSERLFAVLKEQMPAGYGTWASALEESLIRAIVLRMLSDEQLRARQIERLEAEGFLLVPTLVRGLAGYEQSGQSFEEYLPLLLEEATQLDLPGSAD